MNDGIREARETDMSVVAEIYNQGIEDRVATFETRLRTVADMEQWFRERRSRYLVLVFEKAGIIQGWAALEPFSSRPCYAGVASLSIYVRREARGQGVGRQLLLTLSEKACQQGFHKLVLSALANNAAGRRLYDRVGFRLVGTYEKQAQLDGAWLDVSLMEKLL